MPELQIGDLIVQGNLHALMWVDGDKPLVHNVGEGQFKGVLRQSLIGAIYPKRVPPEGYFSAVAVTTYNLYRCHETPTAAAAAMFAIGWATYSGSEAAKEAAAVRQGILKSPHGQGRRFAAEDAKPDQRDWSVAAMYRALKAYARLELALAPKQGTGCAQFISYCYQAASVQRLVGDLPIAENALSLLKQGGGFIKLSDPNHAKCNGSLIDVAQRSAEVFRDKALPMMVSNVKLDFVGSLLQRLENPGSRFTHIGFLVPNMKLTEARFVDRTAEQQFEKSITKNWSIALGLVGYGIE